MFSAFVEWISQKESELFDCLKGGAGYHGRQFFASSMVGKVPDARMIPVEFEYSFVPMLTKIFPAGLHITDIFFRILEKVTIDRLKAVHG